MLALLPFTGVCWQDLKNSCSQVYHPTNLLFGRQTMANLASSWIFLSGLVSKSPFCLIILAAVSSQTSILVEIMIGDHGSNWCNYIFQSSHYQLHLSSHHMYCKCVSVGWWLFLQKNRQLRARWKMRDAERAKARMICMVFLFFPFPFFLGSFLDLSRFMDVHRWSTHRRPQNAQSKRSFCRILFLGCFLCLAKIWWLHHGCICVILPGYSRGSATQGFRGLQCQLCRWFGEFEEFVWLLLVDAARIKILQSSEPRKRRTGLSTFFTIPVLCARIRPNASGCGPASAILPLLLFLSPNSPPANSLLASLNLKT